MATARSRYTEQDVAFIRQARQLVRDLMTPNPLIYWIDFLVTITIAYAALFVYLTAPWFSVPQILSFLVAVFLFYRASIFTHELAHLTQGRFRLFRLVWNLLCGVPMLIPSFLYTDHRHHHMNQTYATDQDGEYAPYARASVLSLLLGLLSLVVFPLLPVLRFGLLTPANYFCRSLRQWVWERASSLGGMNAAYRRLPPDNNERRAALFQELGCFLVVVTLFTLLITGVASWVVLVQLYLLSLAIVVVNILRVLAAHRYLGDGEPMTFLEQLLDSTTIPGGPWTGLWAPLGLRFHALHHLFPTMPYHSMAKAHNRLMQALPPDSPYHQTVRRSLLAALWELVRERQMQRVEGTDASSASNPGVPTGPARPQSQPACPALVSPTLNG